jgi:hypothetical protein
MTAADRSASSQPARPITLFWPPSSDRLGRFGAVTEQHPHQSAAVSAMRQTSSPTAEQVRAWCEDSDPTVGWSLVTHPDIQHDVTLHEVVLTGLARRAEREMHATGALWHPALDLLASRVWWTALSPVTLDGHSWDSPLDYIAAHGPAIAAHTQPDTLWLTGLEQAETRDIGATLLGFVGAVTPAHATLAMRLGGRAVPAVLHHPRAGADARATVVEALVRALEEMVGADLPTWAARLTTVVTSLQALGSEVFTALSSAQQHRTVRAVLALPPNLRAVHRMWTPVITQVLTAATEAELLALVANARGSSPALVHILRAPQATPAVWAAVAAHPTLGVRLWRTLATFPAAHAVPEIRAALWAHPDAMTRHRLLVAAPVSDAWVTSFIDLATRHPSVALTTLQKTLAAGQIVPPLALAPLLSANDQATRLATQLLLPRVTAGAAATPTRRRLDSRDRPIR